MADNPTKAPMQFRVEKDVAVEQMVGVAPVIYFDGAQGISQSGDTVRFNLYQDLLTIDPSKDPDSQELVTRTICARLVMQATTAESVHRWLGEFIVAQKEAANAEPDSNAGE